MRAPLAVLTAVLLSACSGREDKAEGPAFEKIADALDAYGACLAPDAEPEDLFSSLAGRCFQGRPATESRVGECQEQLRNAVLKALEDARFQGRGKLTQKLETYAKAPTAAAPLAKDAACAALATAVCEEQKGWLEGLAKARGAAGRTDPAKLACRGKKVKGEVVPVPVARLVGGDGSQTVEIQLGGTWAGVGAVPADRRALGVAAFDGGAWVLTTPAERPDDKKKPKPKKDEPAEPEAVELELSLTRFGAGGGAPIVAAEKPKLLLPTVGGVRATKDEAVLVGGDGTRLLVVRLAGGKVTATTSEVGGVGGVLAACHDGVNAAVLGDDRRTLLVSADGGATFTRGAVQRVSLGEPQLLCRGGDVLLVGQFGADRAVAATCSAGVCGLFVDLPRWPALGRAALPNGVGLLRADGLFLVPLPAPTDQRPPRARALLLASEVEIPPGAGAYRIEGAVYR